MLHAHGAGAIENRARGKNAVAGAQVGHLTAHLLNGADELVAEARPGLEAEGRTGVEDVQVGAADGGHGHLHHGVGRLLDVGVRHVLNTNVLITMEGKAPHVHSPGRLPA